jgi:hypothetical protein
MRATRRSPNRLVRLFGRLILAVVVGWILLTVVTAMYWFVNARV